MDEKMLMSLFNAFTESDAVEMKYASNGTVFELRKKEAFIRDSLINLETSQKTIDVHTATFDAKNQLDVDGSIKAAKPTKILERQTVDFSQEEKENYGYEIIKSPIVGTFYRAASPDAPPFVEPGAKIKKNQTLCIIEAMKMMNALEAEFDCTIEKIFVTNGDMVEFDQPLFEVKKT